MIEPMIGKGITLGKPRVPEKRDKRAEHLDAHTREGESVAAYQRRVMGQINALDWGSEEEPEP